MIDPQTLKQLRQLVPVFLRENAKLNLSALRTPERAWVGNVLDSVAVISILEQLPPPQPLPRGEGGLRGVRVLDLGTGGGFPLLPLAICKPEWQFTGLDSTGKKIQAVRRIATELHLTNAELLTGRAEALAHDPAHRERYDIVTARAVADIAVLLEYASGFVKPGGHVVLWKSLQSQDELERSKPAQEAVFVHYATRFEYDLDALAREYSLETDTPMVLDEPWGMRQLLVFRKGASRTPSIYPRAVGIPCKDPLNGM